MTVFVRLTGEAIALQALDSDAARRLLADLSRRNGPHLFRYQKNGHPPIGAPHGLRRQDGHRWMVVGTELRH
jgi:hypothetical protein